MSRITIELATEVEQRLRAAAAAHNDSSERFASRLLSAQLQGRLPAELDLEDAEIDVIQREVDDRRTKSAKPGLPEWPDIVRFMELNAERSE
ncbi:MAG TPA: hypothetical protein PKB10_15300 [Tepidisphaeraceae bacterium]|nr:hypothetical protein [Tepidisphaeraceae bacterium]